MSAPELDEESGEKGPPGEVCLGKDEKVTDEDEQERVVGEEGEGDEEQKETEMLQGEERVEDAEMVKRYDVQETSRDISQEVESKCKLLAVSLLNQMGVKFRRRGSLCSDGQNCIYAELLDIEERKVVDLEEKAEDLREKAEDLKEKLKRSVEELAAVKQRHVDFVSEVRSVALKTRRFRKKALKALLRKESDIISVEDDSDATVSLSQDQDDGLHDIGGSSGVEEVETSYLEEGNVVPEEEHLTAKVAVVENVPGKVRGRDDAVEEHADRWKDHEQDTIAKKPLELMEQGSPVRSQGVIVCQLCGAEMVQDLEVAKEHLVKEHPMEVEVMDDEVRSTMPLPRKRGPRGPGRRGRKSRRENSQGQDLQDSQLGMESNREGEGVAGQGQDLQVEENEDPDSGQRHCIKLESKACRAQLSRGKRPVSKRRGTEEDLDTGTLEQLLRNLQRHEDSWPFVRPVSLASAPDYHLLVKNPTNLEKIRRQLDEMKTYRNNRQVLEDIQLVFDNCRLYNESDAEEYECAERLEKYFGKMKEELGLSQCLPDGGE